MADKNNIFEELYEEKKNDPTTKNPDDNGRILVAEATSDAQAKLFKKVAWLSGLAGVIFGLIVIFFFGKYM